MRGIVGHSFNGSNMNCGKEVVLVDIGVCVNTHGQFSGLGTDMYFYFLFKFSDKKKNSRNCQLLCCGIVW